MYHNKQQKLTIANTPWSGEFIASGKLNHYADTVPDTFPKLEVIDVSKGKLNAAALAKLLSSEKLMSSLKELKLGGNNLGSGGAQVLADCPYLESLDLLHVASCGFNQDDLKILAAAMNLPSLKTIVLVESDAKLKSSVEALKTADWFNKVRVLSSEQYEAEERKKKEMNGEYVLDASCNHVYGQTLFGGLSGLF